MLFQGDCGRILPGRASILPPPGMNDPDMTSETDYPVDESAMSTSAPVLDRVSARLRRLSMRADAVHLRLTRGVTLTERVAPKPGDPEDWSFLRRPALLGLLADVSICVGASLPS